MTYLIFIFFISIILIASMIYYKVWQIRIGKTLIQRYNFADINLDMIEKKVVNSAKKFTRLLILTILKIWFKVLDQINKKIQEFQPKIKKLLNKNGYKIIRNTNTASSFIRIIKEYKIKIRRVRKEVENKEKKEGRREKME